eukprot:CAMPEP_0178463034 /NCGR_PEP_ID=MMETSP0689_2-20121128/50124_1 /TAXON_ID=160604 /ORGANISM="Amphidinium massartii, Strain CS-259" /LENGTH=66 /DNA_ID=CAMNT_0020089903 /DNA_START=135 /DNA_END=335 /DNA_ORIENTATION=-
MTNDSASSHDSNLFTSAHSCIASPTPSCSSPSPTPCSSMDSRRSMLPASSIWENVLDQVRPMDTID